MPDVRYWNEAFGEFRAQPARGTGDCHATVTSGGYILSMSYDPTTIATLRRALDEVVNDIRFQRRKSISALEIAEHLLAQAAAGERDLDRLKSSAFQHLAGNVERFPNRAA
jgi:hypothetical protein